MAEKKVKIWVTKYALTKGIFETKAEVDPVEYPGMATIRHGNSWPEHYHGRDWHLDRLSALQQAERMRQAKIRSLRVQLAKYEAMKFE